MGLAYFVGVRLDGNHDNEERLSFINGLERTLPYLGCEKGCKRDEGFYYWKAGDRSGS